MNTKTGHVDTVSKDPQFKGPTDLAIAPDGKLDVVDPFAGTGLLGAIFKVNPQSGATSVLSEGQHFNRGPLGIAVLPNKSSSSPTRTRGPARVVPSSGSTRRPDIRPSSPRAATSRTGTRRPRVHGGRDAAAQRLTLAPNGKTAFLADATKNGIVRVRVDSGAQKVVAHGGKLDDPTDVALGLDGKLYVVNDATNPTVLRIDRSSGNQKVFASGHKLVFPEGITVQPRS